MQKYLLPAFFAGALMISGAGLTINPLAAAEVNQAKFTSDGQAMMPTNWRQWVYVGTALTPNALNDGKAAFPEFHNTYMEPSAFAYWKKHGKFANGTQIAKELTLIRQKAKEDMNPDGSTAEVSGTGFFQGNFSGLELMVKDTKRFAKEPGGWAFFSFGHKLPYTRTAKKFPADACNACHQASAETDYVFTQFYPVLKDAKAK